MALLFEFQAGGVARGWGAGGELSKKAAGKPSGERGGEAQLPGAYLWTH